jgi:hypothetical protein
VKHKQGRDLQLEEYFFGQVLHWHGNPNSVKHTDLIIHSISNSRAKGVSYVLKQLKKVWTTAEDFHMLESYSSLVAEVADMLGRERLTHQQQPASPAGSPQLLAVIPGRSSLLAVSPVLHEVQLQSLLPGRMMGAPNAPAVMGHGWLVEQHGIKVEKLCKASVSCCGRSSCCCMCSCLVNCCSKSHVDVAAVDFKVRSYSMTVTITSESRLEFNASSQPLRMTIWGSWHCCCSSCAALADSCSMQR